METKRIPDLLILKKTLYTKDPKSTGAKFTTVLHKSVRSFETTGAQAQYTDPPTAPRSAMDTRLTVRLWVYRRLGLLPIPKKKKVAPPPFPPLAFKPTEQLYAVRSPAGVPTLYIPLCPFRVMPLAGACERREFTPWPLPSGPLPRR